MVIDRETQQKIKDAANIVEVVGDYVKLTRRGANYMGLCPFHNERTPSFSVSPRKNFCHCFSCHKGGSPVNFLMEKEGISYTEALLRLAKKYGIHVQERELTDEERQRMSEREAMIVANEWAMNHFHDNLLNTEEGRDIGLSYLYSRGITDEAIRRFKIGYSIDRGNALLSKARSQGFDLEVLKQLGLVGTSSDGREFDRFRGRVMFPIRNTSGKPVAFGGRALKGEPAKYINSPESLIYRKSNELFGIFEAKTDIVNNDNVYLMEGYLDVIGSWQAGLKNVVASSGTALTESQISLIHRFTNNVTLIYDGDSAGIRASLRGIDMLLAQKLHVKVLLLPEGEDPDSYAKKHTPTEFLDYIKENETDFIRFKINVLLKDADNNPRLISEAVKSVVTSISCIPDEIERISYIKECARLMDIDEQVISREVAQALITSGGKPQQHVYNEPPRFSSSLEKPESGISNSQAAQAPAGIVSQPSSYLKQEEEILKYCVRYAFIDFPEEDPEEENFSRRSILEYVDEEMEADSLAFSHPPFFKVFNVLKQRSMDFKSAYARFEAEVDADIEVKRKDFQDALILEGGSMNAIRKKETAFKKQMESEKEERMRQFASDFSADFLINHEDNDVREVANRLVAERHVLSAIYSRNGVKPETEEDKLGDIVPRALTELRSEILQSRVREIQQKVAAAIESNDTEQQSLLMKELYQLFHIRKKLAENLGDRTISPKK